MASDQRRTGQPGTETNLDFRIEKRAGYDTLVWNDTGCRPATEPEVQLWQLLAAQRAPAAAQEAVGEIVLFGGYKEAAWSKGRMPEAGTKLYAAPVTAAPADLIERCREILAWQRTGVLPGNALREYANARWPDEHDPLQIAEKETAREAFRILARAAAASTSVALGIDLENFHRAVQRICIKFDGDSPYLSGISEVLDLIDSSPNGGSDPWRGLYAPERVPNRDEYGCFYHPDIPSWDDEREESIAPLLKAQGFDLQCVPGDFSDEAMEEGGERYWQEMREWNPEPEGDGWRLVAIYDTEEGPYSMFVKPLAQAGDAEVQP